LHNGGRKKKDIYCYYNQLQLNKWAFSRLQFLLFGFMNKLASHLERSPLIHSYGYESAGDRPTWLFISSMRLTPTGACAKNLSRRFFASLPKNSKSFMQYAG